MTALRKASAGSDSYGNVWPRPGAIVDVPPDQAAVLLRIADADFTEVPEAAEVFIGALATKGSAPPPSRQPAKSTRRGR